MKYSIILLGLLLTACGRETTINNAPKPAPMKFNMKGDYHSLVCESKYPSHIRIDDVYVTVQYTSGCNTHSFTYDFSETQTTSWIILNSNTPVCGYTCNGSCGSYTQVLVVYTFDKSNGKLKMGSCNYERE